MKTTEDNRRHHLNHWIFREESCRRSDQTYGSCYNLTDNLRVEGVETTKSKRYIAKNYTKCFQKLSKTSQFITHSIILVSCGQQKNITATDVAYGLRVYKIEEDAFLQISGSLPVSRVFLLRKGSWKKMKKIGNVEKSPTSFVFFDRETLSEKHVDIIHEWSFQMFSLADYNYVNE